MKRYISIAIAAICLFASCEKYESVTAVDKDFVKNYEVFWNQVNEDYCFLGEAFGNDKNVDWQAVYDKWMPVVKNEVKDDNELFNIISLSLDVLRDGHVWMISDFKKYSNGEYMLKPDGVTYYGSDFVSKFVQNHYLVDPGAKDDYSANHAFKTRTGLWYGLFERDGKKFAYVYYGDFTKEWTDTDYELIAPVIEEADALILDIRNNPGGNGSLAIKMGNHFMKEKTLVGYALNKTGKGYDDFSEPYPQYCTPSKNYDWSDKQTALLINRGVYSTANLFTSVMTQAPNVMLVGQTSGGGGGLPTTHYLPNGWMVVFSSSSVLLDVNQKHIEPGVAPDHEAVIGDYSTTGKDGIMEKAIEELLKKL